MASLISRVNDALPDPFGLRSKAVEVGLGVVDGALETTAYLAEKAHHAHSGVSKKTELEGGDGPGQFHSPAAKVAEKLRVQLKLGSPAPVSLQGIAALVDAIASKADLGGIDDRLYLLEHGLVLLSRLPRGSILGQHLNNKIVNLLYQDLAHPPASFIGKKYRYRAADGYGTCLWNPEMGRAGSNYARTVQGKHPLPDNQLPSPELLFDTLLKREKIIEHPGGVSSCFFAFANLVIHSLFSTDHESTEGINRSSSYLDLSPIYGNNQAELDSVRIKDGYGRIHPDTFADKRILHMPPSTPAMLLLFCRNHNYIAQKLLEINERGQWSDPPPSDEAKKNEQDEDIFQTARSINCGYFINTILSDYLSGIFGFIREGNSWSLNPLEFFRNQDHSIAPRGEGNCNSVEFAALYHFHASISAADEKWAEDQFRFLFKGKAWDEITVEDYKATVAAMNAKRIDKDGKEVPDKPAHTRTFEGLKRDKETGQFKDADIANLLQEATFNPACAFGARNTPHVMRVIEIMTILQNRMWGAPSLNEFRKFLGLKQYSTFEQWNPNKEVADAARRLYGHPDNLELYIGLQAEEAKAPVPGAGLSANYTIFRAVLVDAIASVRGDRFLTTDYTAHNLTSWGISYAARDPDNSSYGNMIPRLLMTHLPDFFPASNAYTNFPLMAPKYMEGYLKQVGVAHKYDWSRPIPRPPIRIVKAFKEAQEVLAHPSMHSDCADNAKQVLPGKSYLASYNDRGRNQADKDVIAKAFYPDPSTKRNHADLILKIAEQLIRDKSYTVAGGSESCVNIVKDVLNLIPVHFIAFNILGLPLKTDRKPQGTYFEQEVLQNFREIFNYIFLDTDGDSKLAREKQVKHHIDELKRIVGNHISAVAGNPLAFAVDVAGRVISHASHPEYYSWLRRLHEQNKWNMSHTEMTNNAISLAIVTSVQLSQALSHVVDTFLDDDKKPRIIALAGSSTSKDQNTLLDLITEALRLSPITGGTYRNPAGDVSIQCGPTFKRSERIYVSYVESNRDRDVFGSDANEFKERSADVDAIEGDGLYRLHGQEYVVQLIYPVIKHLFGTLKNVRRAPGNSGKLASFTDNVHGTHVRTYFDNNQLPIAWSSNLSIVYDI